MNSNMDLYNQLREVPENAKKPIKGGKLKGFTNISPQWRIEKLTEVFGPCGIGWKFDKPVYEHCLAPDGQIICFCSTNLYVKVDGEWSEPIPGEGGNKFVAMENGGLVPNDDGRKMALTDALSSAAKMVGLAANVYFAEGARDSKYSIGEDGGFDGQFFGTDNPYYPVQQNTAPAPAAPMQQPAPRPVQQYAPQQNKPVQAAPPQPVQAQNPAGICSECGKPITRQSVVDYSMNNFGRVVCYDCQKKLTVQQAPVVDSAPAMPRESAMSMVFPFGKYAGKSIAEIISFDRRTIETAATGKYGYANYPDFMAACRAALG